MTRRDDEQRAPEIIIASAWKNGSSYVDRHAAQDGSEREYPDTPYILKTTHDAEIEKRDQRIAELTEALQNVLGHVDTPIGRRQLRIPECVPEWLYSGREAISSS